MLKVFNVGQGDAFLIDPGSECSFGQSPLLVDSGPTSAKVWQKIPQNELSVLLTHSHSDHIGGMPALIKNKKINTLYIPYFLPEVVSIYNYLKSHVKAKISQPNWKKINNLNTILVGDGDRLCPQHLEVINPPKNPYDCYSEIRFRTHCPSNDELERGDSIRIEGIEEALDFLSSFIKDLPRKSILEYETPLSRHNGSENSADVDRNYHSAAKIFVHQYFISFANRIRNLNHNEYIYTQYYLDSHLSLTANQVSIVFKYKHPSGIWLFTGDADELVFERILNSGKTISSKYLKVPHHGSRENLSPQTLKKISPDVAIISHGNRRFGTSKDTHPHHEIINLLDRFGVKSYYTNDVVKDGKTIIQQAKPSVENGVITFC